jgi:hypothetical protein
MVSYVFIFGFGLAISGIGYYIYSNDEWVRGKVFDYGWRLTKLASNCSEKLGLDLGENRHLKKDDSDDESDYSDEESDYDSYLEEKAEAKETDSLLSNKKIIIKERKPKCKRGKYYHEETNTSYDFLFDSLINDEIKQNMDLIFLKIRLEDNKNVSYLRIGKENMENVEFNNKVIEKQFLQVELEYKESKQVIDIHHNLERFYVSGNKILDKLFLKWYLNYFYQKDLTENYELKIFDKNINLITITDKQIIVFNDDGYTVEDVN